MKSGKRRTLCVDCFGQGIRPYLADSTGTQAKRLLYMDYIAEEFLPWEYPVYVTADSTKKAYVRKRICRTCGGTGYTYTSHPWVVGLLRNSSVFECCVADWVTFQNNRVEEESYPYYQSHFQQAAALLHEIPKLDIKINRMHRRAQKAEGQIEHLEHLYKNKCVQVEALLKALRKAYGHDKPLRSRVPKTVRFLKKKKDKETT